MYSNHYGSPPPELSNNPFIDHTSNALTRYPDITGSDSPSGNTSPQYNSWQQGSNAGTPSGYGQQYAMNTGYQQAPPQNSWNASPGYSQSPYGSPPAMQNQPTGRAFQPSSSFGQQLAGQMNAGYGQQQQQQQGYPSNQQYGTGYQGGYGTSQHQQQASQYLAEFDPYNQQSQTPSSAPSVGPSSTGAPQSYSTPHPRQYIQKHKSELEVWDQYAWKQAFNAFDALKEAWGARKQEIENTARSLGGAGLFGGGGGYGGYNQAQDLARLEALAKEATSNFDSVAASTFQMQEVFSGYRQSGDIASKRRVRESINAALGSLPDWPPQY